VKDEQTFVYDLKILQRVRARPARRRAAPTPRRAVRVSATRCDGRLVLGVCLCGMCVMTVETGIRVLTSR